MLPLSMPKTKAAVPSVWVKACYILSLRLKYAQAFNRYVKNLILFLSYNRIQILFFIISYRADIRLSSVILKIVQTLDKRGHSFEFLLKIRRQTFHKQDKTDDQGNKKHGIK